MAPLNEKPVRLLVRDMVGSMGIQASDSFTRDEALQWFKANYPNVKDGTVSAHLIRLSTNARSRLHYSLRSDGTDDFLFKIDSSRYRLYDPSHDPMPISDSSAPVTDAPVTRVEPEEAGTEFAYEHDLRDYLSRNLQLLEPSLRLYSDEGITGVEFPAGGRFIDILAVDDRGAYVVVELKVSRGYDRVVGQLLRYMSWIKAHHADTGQTVRGIIVAKDISEDLRLACSELPHVALFEYSLSVSVKRLTGI